jgi:hypothetical protein
LRRLDPAKLHVDWASGSMPTEPLLRPALSAGPLSPRTYTLTHSDSTGDLYLAVRPEYDHDRASGRYSAARARYSARRYWQGWRGRYARFMRDEVLAEWLPGDGGLELHLHCHVSRGFVAGPAGWRDATFRRELPLVLEAFRFGDRQLVTTNPELDNSPV